MSKRIAFIHKDHLTLTDHCAWPVVGGVTPMREYYTVIIEAPRPIPTREEIEAELVRLRALHPDVTTVDDEGNKSTVYGKYSYDGLCTEPYEEIGG